jgi:hypothetical protein
MANEQTNGVAMGSPLSPVTANYFMEYFEEMVLETAIYKHLCWFRYLDNTFVIWPHGSGKLAEFLDHLNGVYENIKFTMDTERDGHRQFLDIDIYIYIYTKLNGSLGHRVYSKPTHTNLYIHSKSCYNPSYKQAVLSTLVHRARAPCDKDSVIIWSSSGTLSSGTATVTGISNGLSICRKNRSHPGEAHFVRPSSLCQRDFQSHQPYAIQAQYQVCGPPAEESC